MKIRVSGFSYLSDSCITFHVRKLYHLSLEYLGIRYVSGSVEAACGLGLADAVVDLVETGTTMRVRDRTPYIINTIIFINS